METPEDCPPAEKKLKETEIEESTTPKIPAALENNPGFTPPTPFSKNQLKKQRKLAQYEQVRKEKRQKEKERQKQKRKEAAEKGLPIRTGPSRKELKKKQQAAVENENALRIAIDLDCDDMMSERDVAKCVKQCLRIYTINRRSERPVQLHLTGIKSEGNIHKCLKKNDGWENWQLKYHFDEDHLKVFQPNSQLVYLTSESDTVLESLEPSNVYCIGGLVDHNHHKNYCHDKATREGLRTARLPLGENVDMKTRTVLTTYHVFEILVRVAEGKSWAEAILQTIPPRKGAKLKECGVSKENKEIVNCSNDLEEKIVEDKTTEKVVAESVTTLDLPVQEVVNKTCQIEENEGTKS
ncbi:tRNA methyltransferase 10 homolog A [Lucilia cuprina]|uniref:tRNA methyltransferase 10 homolog A n=1 Tax=Lucilia cuprina TaxID=7375 RepID=UPI001F050ED6|nr:tRNA methyltransferase 10 homolog A [Lucilia cuprina]